MCTAGQRVSLTITGPGPSFFDDSLQGNGERDDILKDKRLFLFNERKNITYGFTHTCIKRDGCLNTCMRKPLCDVLFLIEFQSPYI